MAVYKLLLPKMGESVAEATVIKWNKNPGDYIEADETVMEIATDKVDSDVPSPVAGKLKEQFFQINDVVQVGSVIATIETVDIEETSSGNDIGAIDRNDAAKPAVTIEIPVDETNPAISVPGQDSGKNAPSVETQRVFEEQYKPFSEQVPFVPKQNQGGAPKSESSNITTSRFYSPLVKNIAAQEGIGNEELDKIPGTGSEGRLTKDDLLAYLQNKLKPADENSASKFAATFPVIEFATGEPDKRLSSIDPEIKERQPAFNEKEPADQQASTERRTGTPLPEQRPPVGDSKPVPASEANEEDTGSKPEPLEPKPVSESSFEVPKTSDDKIKEAHPSAKSFSAGDEIIEMDRMRRLIADHMLMSKQTSPHVTSFVEADVTNLVSWREKIKGNFEKREGQKITYMPLFIEAVVRAIKDMPMINVTVNGTQIIKKKDINISMATALPSGNLIVPVIKKADELSLVGLTKAVNDLASRARSNKLKPDDIQDGTFTITNIGSFGNVMGTPIINQPQVAILAVGAIKKKVAVIETPEGDMIGIRHMMYLSLSYDHRVVDGALGGSFIKRIADYLENWDSLRSV